ncbi:MAG: aminoglycoside 6-adenylyltransferase [Butyrivibrio sp.]|nr:aminoglycoside 6-adenylyltransferase [Butyrivibrio sp.]
MNSQVCKVIDRYKGIRNKLCELAKEDIDIHAVFVIGSSTRDEIPADEFSDLDLIIVTDNPQKWFSGEYPELLGRIRISFLEPTLGGGMERRSIYEEDKDVDMIIFTPEQFEKALKEGVAGWVMNRGYRVLYDAGRFHALSVQYVSSDIIRPGMTEAEFTNLVNDFYFHNIWAYKKLRRGELWSAKMCIDAYLKNQLLKMIEEYQIAVSGVDVWHDGRFLDQWADHSIREELKKCFAHYERTDCRDALMATHVLFARLSRSVADSRGYVYPEEARLCAADYLSD